LGILYIKRDYQFVFLNRSHMSSLASAIFAR